MIIDCKCEHKEQDKLNGKNKRVHNATAKKVGNGTGYRCSVCKTVKAV